MDFTLARDGEVIGQRSWDNFQPSHLACAWMQHEGNEHHGEGTSLGDAAMLGMGLSKCSTNSIDVLHSFVEVLVCLQNSIGEASLLQQRIEQDSAKLVEAFPNVSASASERDSRQSAELVDATSKIPRIFSPD